MVFCGKNKKGYGEYNKITITKNKHYELYSPVGCIVKCGHGICEKIAVNAIGALLLAFFNTSNMRYIEIDSSHINSFINISVASCTNKMHGAKPVSFPSRNRSSIWAVWFWNILVFTTDLLTRGFRIFTTSLNYQTLLEINTSLYVLEHSHGKRDSLACKTARCVQQYRYYSSS